MKVDSAQKTNVLIHLTYSCPYFEVLELLGIWTNKGCPCHPKTHINKMNPYTIEV